MSCCTYKIQDFNRLITIQRRTDSADGAGGVTSTWATYTTAYAILKPKNINERLQAKQLEAMTSHKITVPYTSVTVGITTRDRVKYAGRYFNILSIINIDEGNEYLQLEALENAEAAL